MRVRLIKVDEYDEGPGSHVSALLPGRSWDLHPDASLPRPWKPEDVAAHRKEATGATGTGAPGSRDTSERSGWDGMRPAGASEPPVC